MAFQGDVIIWGGGMPTTRDPFFVPIVFSTAVPEPSAAVLVAAGLISAATCVRRRRR